MAPTNARVFNHEHAHFFCTLVRTQNRELLVSIKLLVLLTNEHDDELTPPQTLPFAGYFAPLIDA